MSSPSEPTDSSVPAVAHQLRLYAERRPDGEVLATFLLQTAAGLLIWTEPGPSSSDSPTEAQALPEGALAAIFQRYGRPIEEGLELAPLLVSDDEWDAPLGLATAEGPATLRRFRFLPFGWVHPADYLLWQVADAEPVAAPAPLVKSALLALARAAARSS